MRPDLFVRVKDCARVIGSSALALVVLVAAVPVRTVSAQTPQRQQPDSATLYNAAERLYYQADTLRRGSRSDRRKAADLFRRAAELYLKAGAQRDVAAAFHSSGVVYFGLGQSDSALVNYRQAIPIERAVGARAGEATTLNNIGAAFADLGHPDSALMYYRQALPIRRAVSDRRGEATTLSNIGAVYRETGQPDSALVYYRDALPITRAVGDRDGEATTLNDIGLVYGATGAPDSALGYLRQAILIERAEGDRAGEATTLNNIGELYSDIGQPDSALVYHREALPIRRAVGDLDGEATTLGNIGATFAGIGQPDSALVYYRRTLAMRRAVGDHAREAITLANIGDLFRSIGRPDSALAYLRQALPMLRTVGNRVGEGNALSNIGGTLGSLGQADSALAYYRRALLVERATENRAGEATVLSNIGEVERNIGQPDSALAYYRQALPIERAVGNRAAEAATLNNMGAAFYAIGRIDSALTYQRLALPIRSAVRDRAGEAKTLGNIGLLFASVHHWDSALVYDREALSTLRVAGDRTFEAVVLNNIAEAYRELGRPDSALTYHRRALPIRRAVGDRAGEAMSLSNIGALYHDIGVLDSAVVYFDRSAALFAAISNRTGNEFNQLTYNETTARLYGEWALTWLARAPHAAVKTSTSSVDSASAAYGALAASERGQAQALLHLMRDTTAHVETDADFPAEGVRLAAGLRRSHAAGLVYYSTHDTLITWLIPATGKIEVFRRAIVEDTLAVLIGAFREGLGVASGDTRLALRGVQLERGVTEASAHGVTGSGVSRAADLAAILLPPELVSKLGGAKEVVIVPQGPLALVPFAALPVGGADELFGAKLAIRYAPSLATLGQAELRPGLVAGAARAAALKQALVVGNPMMPEITTSTRGRDRLMSLPGAEAESRAIATQLGATTLTGAAATEAEVVRRLPSAPLVHLATHGFAYSTEAMARSSFIALSPDSVNDGLLTVGKLLDNHQLKLTADLVVLSACQTGLGNLRQAEGTVGLQRAFLAKGARSVLVSLWSVSDAATSALMTAFYRHWLQDPDGPSKAEALRRSQEEIRRIPGWELPRFWAAFQLVGAK